MTLIGISDHGPAFPGTTTFLSLWMLDRAPAAIDGVKVLWSCEANIINHDGDLDIEARLQKRLDFVIVGLHQDCGFVDRGEKENTAAFQRALRRNRCHVLAHPFEAKYPYDSERVIRAAFESGVAPEINLSVPAEPNAAGKYPRRTK